MFRRGCLRAARNNFFITRSFQLKLHLGWTEDGRRRRRHGRRDGRRDGRTDGRAEDDDGDGDDGMGTTGRTDGRTIYIVPKSQIRHWDQYASVKVNLPYSHLSGHAQTFLAG